MVRSLELLAALVAREGMLTVVVLNVLPDSKEILLAGRAPMVALMVFCEPSLSHQVLADVARDPGLI